MGAEVRAALTDSSALNGSTATWTGVIGLLVDAKVILKIATAVDPVDAGAVVLDSESQGCPNGLQKFCRVLEGERIAGPQGVEVGSEKGFIRVDVP